MSKDIIVLTPNGRRQKVHCTPDTSMLQVLEDVCQKQGFQPTEYDLKHHNHILDLTTTVRFSNLPNKATLEMVETERRREEKNVTVGLMLEDGERRMADFPPHTSLYDLISSLAATELDALQQPTILYMRQEVVGVNALKEKTLRQLGLIGGRAILRLLNKNEEAKQANVSTVYRCPLPEKNLNKETAIESAVDTDNKPSTSANDIPGPSEVHRKEDLKNFDPLKIIKTEKSILKAGVNKECEAPLASDEKPETASRPADPQPVLESASNSNTSLLTQEKLERRLKIEEEVTFLGTQKAIAFMQPEEVEDELEDLPDDFYELTIEEVRRLYHDLQQHRLELENTPLLTSTKREEVSQQNSHQKLNSYKSVVVRIQFPDRIILQGIFSPTNTIEDVRNFVKEHLQTPEQPFHIFTTPIKEALDPKMTLLEAQFVPCVHMHFKWQEEQLDQQYLKKDVYLNKTTSDAASILASKYRAPTRRKMDGSSDTSQKSNRAASSTDKNSKLPKWFKK